MTIGIYSIHCSVSGRCYVGSSNFVEKRWSWHRHALRKRKHHSRALQAAWVKHGEENFTFNLLEECPVDALREREAHWLRELNALGPNGYSVCPSTDSVRGYKVHPEVVEKLRAAAIKIGADPEERARRSERARAQHAAGNLGRKTWPEGTTPVITEDGRRRMGESWRKHIASQSPEEMARRARLRKTINGQPVEKKTT